MCRLMVGPGASTCRLRVTGAALPCASTASAVRPISRIRPAPRHRIVRTPHYSDNWSAHYAPGRGGSASPANGAGAKPAPPATERAPGEQQPGDRQACCGELPITRCWHALARRKPASLTHGERRHAAQLSTHRDKQPRRSAIVATPGCDDVGMLSGGGTQRRSAAIAGRKKCCRMKRNVAINNPGAGSHQLFFHCQFDQQRESS